MGTYRVPRDTKGESRILVIFSTKALIYTIVGVGIGYLINVILNAIDSSLAHAHVCGISKGISSSIHIISEPHFS